MEDHPHYTPIQTVIGYMVLFLGIILLITISTEFLIILLVPDFIEYKGQVLDCKSFTLLFVASVILIYIGRLIYLGDKKSKKVLYKQNISDNFETSEYLSKEEKDMFKSMNEQDN